MSDDPIPHNPGGLMAEIDKHDRLFEQQRERVAAMSEEERTTWFAQQFESFAESFAEMNEHLRKQGPTAPGAALLAYPDNWFKSEVTKKGGITYLMGAGTLEKIEDRAKRLGVVPYWKKSEIDHQPKTTLTLSALQATLVGAMKIAEANCENGPPQVGPMPSAPLWDRETVSTLSGLQLRPGAGRYEVYEKLPEPILTTRAVYSKHSGQITKKKLKRKPRKKYGKRK